MIANEFNDFFVSIGDKLASKITSNINLLSFVNNISNSMVMSKVSPNEVLQIIQSLKNSSPGWDDIPTYMAKQCVNNIIEPLTYLINKYFSSGIFPIELKIAKVVPIFKSGDTSTFSNYRPISILSFFSKIFEKIMYNHIVNFMDII